jgi:hypothetical protein
MARETCYSAPKLRRVLTVTAVDAVVLARAPIATHLARNVQEPVSCKNTNTQSVAFSKLIALPREHDSSLLQNAERPHYITACM